MKVFFILFALLKVVISHLPYDDNGVHTSFDTAFIFEDENIARSLNLQFNCSSKASYSEVLVQNSTTFHVGLGIPNCTTLYNLKPNLYIVGKYLEPSNIYPAVGSNTEIEIPDGYTAYEVKTSETGLFFPFGETDISGVVEGGIPVNVTQPGSVYLIVPPTNSISRVWLSVGTKELHHEVSGTISHAEVKEWYSCDTLPNMGEVCSGSTNSSSSSTISSSLVSEIQSSSNKVFVSIGTLVFSIVIWFL